ncbi:Disease resistance protein [Nymphaea thermarum]|nr:Disease resistance protein [Nymphaea thermarum]
MTTVIDNLVQTPISILLGDVTSLLKEKVDLVLNAKDDLKVLQKKLERLQNAIKDREREPFFSNQRDRDLGAQLKDVFYDAQDIIERYQTTIALCKRDKHSVTSWNKVSKPWTTLCSCFKEHVSASYNLANDIQNINQRLDNIKENNKMMADLLGITARNIDSQGHVHGKHDDLRVTTPHMGGQSPIGRKDDKNEIVKRFLSNDSTENSKTQKGGVSIISIVGKGGIGKTTLAKMVFKEMKEHFGERRWWVCVPERPNREDLVRQILRVCKGSDANTDCSLSELCTQLRNELLKEKFLLVLDDVWEIKWWEEEVEGTLMAGAMGSNILITSRKKHVSDMMRASYMHELREFSFEQSWELFLKEALKEGQTEEDLVMHNVRDVGERIVRKCRGLPLVIKTVGSMMRQRKTCRENWKFVEASGIWKWKMHADSSLCSEIDGNILPGLMLSYNDLPHYLKSCFVYCCIYPKDYEIERETLIRLWVAHGLIEEEQGIDVEDTANQYIEDLIKRCLIETHDRFYEGTCLKLHDILHDLALYIGGNEYSHASSTEHTRHLSLLGVSDAEVDKHNASGAANKLRTLFCDSYFGSKSDLPLVYIEHLSTNFKWLRVLSLTKCWIDELPKSIEDLSLLKYLDLSDSHVKRLPNSISRLCNLQTLDLSYSGIEELPNEMGKLCNLRYLGLYETESLKFVAEGLGKLTNLRTLHTFMVCVDKGNTRGCNINELKDLKKLKGELSIKGLCGERVKVMDAKKAELKKKHELNGVKFYFNGQENNRADNASEERGLLEALEPSHDIESLRISYYKGDRPEWCLDGNYRKLRTLWLFCCPSWAAVIGIQSLEELKVHRCPTLGELRSMPLLKTLKISECDGLNTIGDLPALESLRIWHCAGLNTIGDLPALESLEIGDCDGLNTIGGLPALESLVIWHCDGLNTIGDLPALESLELRKCDGVNRIGDFPALESLDIEKCDGLNMIGDMPAVKTLRLLHLPNWESTFTSMPCLTKAEFDNCAKMQMEDTSDELAGLHKLRVRNCPSARLGWKLLEQLPNLIVLTLDPKSVSPANTSSPVVLGATPAPANLNPPIDTAQP